MRSIFCFLLFILPVFAFADTFVVTSNADDGRGTLRDALQQAASNGTAVRDSIIFDIADTSQAGRKIILLSTLPAITGNLTIDGTSQKGSRFGVSAAAVEITINQFPQNVYSYYFFTTSQSASNIEVDGLFIYQPDWNYNSGVNFYGLSFNSCSNIQVGRPLKGNYFLGLTETISGDSCNYLTIQSNIDGLNIDGSLSNQLWGTAIYYSVYAISFTNTNNILIGGNNSNQGNYIIAYTSIQIQSCLFPNDTSTLRIYNNKLGTDINDTCIFYGTSPVVHSNIYLKNVSATVDIKNNSLTGEMALGLLTQYFYIQGNEIYNPDYSSDVSTKIDVSGTAGGMIGGPNPGDGNKIFNQNVLGYNAISSLDIGVTIYKNSIYCNQNAGSPDAPGLWTNTINGFSFNFPAYPWAIIDSTGIGFVRGRAEPNCRIDIYQDDECPACEGKIFLASVQSAADGTWSYAGNFTGVVVGAATDGNGTTFAFTNPVIYDDSMGIKQPSCGKRNGVVTGLKLIGGDNVEWRKVYYVGYAQMDSLYSTQLNPANLEAGTYIVKPRLGATCNGLSQTYTLIDITPVLDSQYLQVTQPSCGQSTGSITGMGVTNGEYSKLRWVNLSSGQVVGTSLDITGLGPGKYKLYATDTSGGGCGDSSQTYVLANQAGPSLLTDSVQITPATCGIANGSVTNISYQNATGSVYTAWEDSAGNIISNSLNLLQAPAGSYRLVFKDQGGCDTITTPYYTIGSKGIITLDTSNLLATPSSCRGATGGITGITATGATLFTWVNTATGQTVGNAANIYNLPPGTYQLTVSNGYGCTAQTSVIQVGQTGFIPLSVLDYVTVEANCGAANGSISIHQFSVDSALYSLQWIDSSTNTAIIGGAYIQNLAPGYYILYATDTNACRKLIFSDSITQLGKPQFNYSQLQIISDTCNLAEGAVLHLQMQDTTQTYTWAWFNTTGQQQGTTPNNLINLFANSYYASVATPAGCAVTSDTFTVANTQISPAAPQATGAYVQRGTPATIQVTNPLPGIYNLYDTLSATIPASSSSAGVLTTPPVYYDKYFYVQYVTGGCASPVLAVMVKVFDSTVITVPNAFSPNGDGINDTWKLSVQGNVTNYSLTVFNRYGRAVFATNDLAKQWDGTLNGKPLPAATYYYILQAVGDTGRPVRQSGWVVIVR